MKIGIFGVELGSVNFGVSALALTQLKILGKIQNDLNLNIEYYLFSDDQEDTVHKTEELLQMSGIVVKYLVRIRTGVRGIHRLCCDINECDLVIDLTFGDSFSDIYGIKFFWLYSMPKIVTILKKKCLVLAPQTIGPFYHRNVNLGAKYILNKADYIFVRDELSLDCARKLTNRDDIVLTSDLAMGLPFKKEQNGYIIDKKINVGLNVSSLLWNDDPLNPRFVVKLNYRQLILEILTQAVQRGDIVIHLITHVYDKKGFTEYSLAEKLHQDFEGTILAPRFQNPIEAKNYIAELDVFIGSRMHATIGAFSSGVPVIPIAYSRKFAGLYGTLGYSYCIDCGRDTTESAMEKICYGLDHLDELKRSADVAYEKACNMNEKYESFLSELILKMR